ncbi:hypothetical protein F4777DRAFT_600937 [Nemania sp. FL0916]|nr:hypothetical protein F4777DRAFT_600937 [Nemania sp. FL0916]
MEVVGTVAAVAQLCGVLIKAIDSTAQLRDILRQGPAQYSCWVAELTALEEAMSVIKDSTSLHRREVMGLIAIINGKIENLTAICQKHRPPSEARFFTKLLWVPRSRSIQNQIVQNFESLEHDKTTLILLINAPKNSISVIECPQETMGKDKSSGRSRGSKSVQKANSKKKADPKQSAPNLDHLPATSSGDPQGIPNSGDPQGISDSGDCRGIRPLRPATYQSTSDTYFDTNGENTEPYMGTNIYRQNNLHPGIHTDSTTYGYPYEYSYEHIQPNTGGDTYTYSQPPLSNQSYTMENCNLRGDDSRFGATINAPGPVIMKGMTIVGSGRTDGFWGVDTMPKHGRRR